MKKSNNGWMKDHKLGYQCSDSQIAFDCVVCRVVQSNGGVDTYI